MNELLKTPKLRFRGFSDEWEEKILNEFLEQEIREVAIPSKPYLGLGVRSHFKGLMKRPNSDPNKLMMDKLFIVRPDDLVVNITFGWEGAVAIAEREDDGGLVSHRFPTYRFNEESVSGEFFKYVFSSKRFKHELGLASPGGAGRNRVLSKKEFLKIKIKAPNKKEQKKIAGFLGVVDDKISGLEKKKELLEKYKKGLMQKIFSQQIRFKDENGKNYPDWVEGEFEEIVENIPSKPYQVLNSQIKLNGFFPVVDQGQQYIAGKTDDKDKLLVSTEDLVIFGDHTVVTKFIDVSSKEFKNGFAIGADGVKIIKLRLKGAYILEYIYQYMQFKPLRAEGYKRHYSLLKKLRIPTPIESEQRKVADLFTALDDKIELQNKKLQQAKKFKKSLLQKMFV